MPAKTYDLGNGRFVDVYKRKTNRSLRLTLAHDGKIRVSIPAWAPYRVGYEFAKSKLDWIDQQHKRPTALKHGMAIGKAHRLLLTPATSATKVTTRLKDNTISVKFPPNLAETGHEVQEAAKSASIRALRVQAEQLLPQRLANLAQIHDFNYKSVSIKQLKGRWGSCDNQKRIMLNLYLMQLPWELIDYVLMHELTHTRVLKHGQEFWLAMETVLPQTKRLKKELRAYQPVLDGLG